MVPSRRFCRAYNKYFVALKQQVCRLSFRGNLFYYSE